MWYLAGMNDHKNTKVDNDRDLDRALEAAKIVERENRDLLMALATMGPTDDSSPELGDELSARASTRRNDDPSEDVTFPNALDEFAKRRGRLRFDDQLKRDDADECK